MVRDVAARDSGEICDIYNHYILHTTATFEEEPLPSAEMEKRIAEITKRYPWLVYEKDGGILGYCYASKWRDRSAYRHTAEVTIYVRNGCGGKGAGTKLYTELLCRLRDMNVHAVMSVIAQPNEGSVKLHESFGFRNVGSFREIVRKFDAWIDVGYWELIL